jgi:hypothetical protein
MLADGDEYGRLYHLYGTGSATGFYMVANRGNLRFGSGYGSAPGTVIPAMEITGASGTTGGNVLIGDYSATSASSRLHIKGNGYTSLFKAENSSQSTPAFEVLETEQILGVCRGYTGSSGIGAFDFRFTPSSSTSNGMGLYVKSQASNAGNLVGTHLETRNTSTSSSSDGAIGLKISTSADYSGGKYVTGLISNVTSTTGVITAGEFVSDGNNTSGLNQGILVTATNAANNIGVYATSRVGDGINIGVQGDASGALYTYGVWGEATNDPIGFHHGVIGRINVNSSGNSGLYGVYGDAVQQACTTIAGTTTCAGAAGYFAGDLLYTGALYYASDIMFKDQINAVSNASNLLAQFQPKNYVFKNQAYPNMNFETGTHYGFIAQDVEVIMPSLVQDFTQPPTIDSAGNILHQPINYKAVNYIEFVPLLVAAFNEQKLVIDSLLNALQNPTPIINPTNTNKIQLSNSTGFILNQNDPNPFTESTIITYNIPEAVNSAKIIFTNSTGVIINTIVIGERGSGQLEVYASDLSKGIYVYSLVCDGKVIASKKMVKQ